MTMSRVGRRKEKKKCLVAEMCVHILFALEKDNISKRWVFTNFAIFRTSLLSIFVI